MTHDTAAREILYRWGIITLAEWIPEPKYTADDCRDFDPAELGF